jgi:hypothetical protein
MMNITAVMAHKQASFTAEHAENAEDCRPFSALSASSAVRYSAQHDDTAEAL